MAMTSCSVPASLRLRSLGLVALTSGSLLIGAGAASAEPVVDPDLTATALTSVGATGYAETSDYVLANRLHVTVTDTRADSRCAYVSARFVITRWTDTEWKKVARVCGDGESAEGVWDKTPPTFASVDHVEVKVCREQGFGTDPCSDVVSLAP